MSNSDNQESSPIWWPAEWVTERGFWREVATRTLAASFSLLLIGIPAILFTVSTGTFTWQQAAPILIGIGLYAALAIAYVIALRLINYTRVVREDYDLLKSAKDGPNIEGKTGKELQDTLDVYLDTILNPRMKLAQKRTTTLVKFLNYTTLVVGAVIAGVIPFLPALFGA